MVPKFESWGVFWWKPWSGMEVWMADRHFALVQFMPQVPHYGPLLTTNPGWSTPAPTPSHSLPPHSLSAEWEFPRALWKGILQPHICLWLSCRNQSHGSTAGQCCREPQTQLGHGAEDTWGLGPDAHKANKGTERSRALLFQTGPPSFELFVILGACREPHIRALQVLKTRSISTEF